ncbi:HNH endonuclease [Kitasatospora sp. NPDC051914]|uniref:HNH endonuclease n=1 Tax=Kitasatospora sp. NPDC051914 TaxID=3154945 RepID=UPI003447803B
MSLVNDLVDHYRELIERGELAPNEVPGPKEMSEEWCVSRPVAISARRRLLEAGLAASAPSRALPLGPITDEDMARFWLKVDPLNANGCTLWNASTRDAYGQFRLNGRMVYAHRVSYEHLTGEPIPEGMDIDHVFARGCRSTLCVRPEHLEIVTHHENVRRARAAERYLASVQVITEPDDD